VATTHGPAKEFTLDGVYPWARTLDENVGMIALTGVDLGGRILGCGDGPAAFNAEVTRRGGCVTSVDPLYRFSGDEIRRRVEATYPLMLDLTRRAAERDDWNHGADPDDLGRLRLSAMRTFLEDYEAGQRADRYLDRSLPRLGFDGDAFDLALCSHFLFLYSDQFDTAFHVDAIGEMMRVAREARVFPLFDLEGRRSRHLDGVMAGLREGGFEAEVVRVGFEFQKGANEMLRVRRRDRG
jgi:hypothetical protein